MDKLSKEYLKYKSYEKHFVHFRRGSEDSDFCPMYMTPPKEDGLYVTIRCGYSGIYQTLNQWKDGKWMAEACDGSTTIAYSRNKVTL
jgi:hypothetical protein